MRERNFRGSGFVGDDDDDEDVAFARAILVPSHEWIWMMYVMLCMYK